MFFLMFSSHENTKKRSSKFRPQLIFVYNIFPTPLTPEVVTLVKILISQSLVAELTVTCQAPFEHEHP